MSVYLPPIVPSSPWVPLPDSSPATPLPAAHTEEPGLMATAQASSHAGLSALSSISSSTGSSEDWWSGLKLPVKPCEDPRQFAFPRASNIGRVCSLFRGETFFRNVPYLVENLCRSCLKETSITIPSSLLRLGPNKSEGKISSVVYFGYYFFPGESYLIFPNAHAANNADLLYRGQLRPFVAPPSWPPGELCLRYCAAQCRRFTLALSDSTTNTLKARTGCCNWAKVNRFVRKEVRTLFPNPLVSPPTVAPVSLLSSQPILYASSSSLDSGSSASTASTSGKRKSGDDENRPLMRQKQHHPIQSSASGAGTIDPLSQPYPPPSGSHHESLSLPLSASTTLPRQHAVYAADGDGADESSAPDALGLNRDGGSLPDSLPDPQDLFGLPQTPIPYAIISSRDWELLSPSLSNAIISSSDWDSMAPFHSMAVPAQSALPPSLSSTPLRTLSSSAPSEPSMLPSGNPITALTSLPSTVPASLSSTPASVSSLASLASSSSAPLFTVSMSPREIDLKFSDPICTLNFSGSFPYKDESITVQIGGIQMSPEDIVVVIENHGELKIQLETCYSKSFFDRAFEVQRAQTSLRTIAVVDPDNHRTQLMVDVYTDRKLIFSERVTFINHDL